MNRHGLAVEEKLRLVLSSDEEVSILAVQP